MENDSQHITKDYMYLLIANEAVTVMSESLFGGSGLIVTVPIFAGSVD